MDIEQIKQRLRNFAEARDWDQFHSPKNLSMALIVEAAELVEHFQWLSERQSEELDHDRRAAVAEELADILIYTLRLASQMEIDLGSAAWAKLEKNRRKYPVEKARGTARKYTEL